MNGKAGPKEQAMNHTPKFNLKVACNSFLLVLIALAGSLVASTGAASAPTTMDG